MLCDGVFGCGGCWVTVRVVTLSSSGGGSAGAIARYPEKALARSRERRAEMDAAIGAGVDVEALGAYYGAGADACWHGAGATRLGLSGVPEVVEIEALMEGIDPSSGVGLGRKFGDKSARGFDATFSAQKEVSILWAASDVETRAVIEQAVVDSVTAVLDDVAGARASTRMRTGPDRSFLAPDGKPVVVPAEGPAVALIPEFTSRLGDPQMHVHSVISSKVWEPTTERFLALDGRELKLNQRALSGLFHVGLEAELASKLGVSWGAREYTYARTITGIDRELVDAFSNRSADAQIMLEEKLGRFVEANGHEPSGQQRYRMEREAVLQTRPNKQAEDIDFDGWGNTIQTITGLTPTELAASVTGHTINPPAVSVEEVLEAAVGELVDRQSTFTRGDVLAELSRLQPLDAATAAEVVATLNVQADRVLEQFGLEVTPVGTDRPVQRWTVPEVLEQETRILEHIDRATALVIEPNIAVERFAPEWLDSMQLAAAGRVASASDFEVIVGLAGTGKTTMLQTAVDTLTHEGKTVFGLAPSAVAAQVLADETLMPAENVSKFLWEHLQRNGGPAPEFRLPAGATLIVDEAGMVSTPQWASLTDLAAVHGWRVRAVGDPYQFSAVGRGGIFEHLTATLPDHRISRLEQIHRFDAPWEADASAGIRAGDPAALDPYFDNGRVHVVDPTSIGHNDLVDQAVDLYMHHRSAGVDVAMFASSNKTVDWLNAETQDRLNHQNLLGPKIGNQSNYNFHIGDQIETRQNNRGLVTDRNLFVKNRDRWTITNNNPLGVTVTGKTGTVTLPHDYLTEHVRLAYAQTSHASQGRTIRGVGITVIDPDLSPIDRAGLYVSITRATQTNDIFINATNHTQAREHLETAITRRWIDTPAINHLTPPPAPLTKQTQTAHQALADYEQQTLFDQAPTPPVNPTPPEPPTPSPSLFEAEPPTPGPVFEPEEAATNVWARRSEAQPRQHQQHPDPVEPSFVETVTVLGAEELMGHLQVVDELAWPVQNAPAEIERISAAQTGTRDRYNEELSAFNDLVDTRDEHAAHPPLLRGIKKWETVLDGYDRSLERSRNSLDRLAGHLEELKDDRIRWAHYQSLTTQLRLGDARNIIAQDRENRGTQQLNNPTLTDRLGQPPTEPDALTAWKNAAGAIEQHKTINNHFDMPRHHQITNRLTSITRTAIKALGQHVGIDQIPELQPQPITRHIEGPSLGR